MSDLSTINAAASALSDPAATPQTLGAIAQMYPTLRYQVAMHPNAYPALLDWLGGLGDPTISAAVASRRSTGVNAVLPPQMPTSAVPQVQLPQVPAPVPQPVQLSPAMAYAGESMGVPGQPVCVPNRAGRIWAAVLFILGGLIGFGKFNLQGPGRMTTWAWGVHPLGWSTGTYFMCDSVNIGWDNVQGGIWESTVATAFYIVASALLIVCGIICLTVGKKNIIQAGTIIAVILAGFTVVSSAFAIYGMTESRLSWRTTDGGPVFIVGYLIFLAVPLLVIMVMKSKSVITLHSRKVLLVTAMVFGAVIFQLMTAILNDFYDPEPELGDILLMPALLLLVFMIKDPATVRLSQPRRSTTTS